MYLAWRGEVADSSFLELMILAKHSRASDRRDKIFGLLGIKTSDSDPENGKPIINADYSMSFEALSTTMARRILLDFQDIRLLTDAGHQRIPDLPTWAPSLDTVGCIHHLHSSNPHGNTTPRISESTGCHQKDCLSFEGLQVHTITHVIDNNQPNLSSIKRWHIIEMLEYLQNLVPRLRSLALDESIALCFTLGREITGYNDVSDKQAHVDAFLAFCNWSVDPSLLNENVILPPPDTASDEVKTAYQFFQLSAKITIMQTFYLGPSGLAIGPKGLREGDVVAIIFGGDTPFALRRVEDGEGQGEDEHYMLLCPSYVSGIMDGEAIQRWKDGEADMKTFYII